MHTLTRSASVRDRVMGWRAAGQRTALVPTMGTLHKGHMSLVAEAQERTDHVVVSIVVDQRTPGQTFEADRELLTNIGADVLFMPPVQELFPVGRGASAAVSLPGLDNVIDGISRPGHFASILTVLVKLFNIVCPDIVLLGERDFQQLVMVRRLVEDLFIPVEVVGCPTFRESDGLALAGANRHLTTAERAMAPLLHETLAATAAGLDAGERDYASLEQQALQRLSSAGFVTEYFVIRQASDLAVVHSGMRDLVIMVAARLGVCRLSDSLPVRLIDRL